jgi:hypothetical protein
MGAEKHAIAEREEAFARKAVYEGWRCAVCNMTPIYDERDVFFRTKMCGYCAHVAAKDD